MSDTTIESGDAPSGQVPGTAGTKQTVPRHYWKPCEGRRRMRCKKCGALAENNGRGSTIRVKMPRCRWVIVPPTPPCAGWKKKPFWK